MGVGQLLQEVVFYVVDLLTVAYLISCPVPRLVGYYIYKSRSLLIVATGYS